MKAKTICRTLRRSLCLLLGLLCCFVSPGAFAAESEEGDLSRLCTYTSGSVAGRVYIERIIDYDLTTYQNFHEGGNVSISWEESYGVGSIFIEWKSMPEPYTVIEYDGEGNVLFEGEGPTENLNELIYLKEGARSIYFTSASDMVMTELHAYKTGYTPHDYHDWETLPEKLDYLVLAMHPDDDILFLAGAITTLCNGGYTGTVAYLGTRARQRCTEALNGAWVMGVRYRPVLGGYPDIPPEYKEQYKNTFTEKIVIQYLVKLFRQYKPELVVTQDVKGEYGHWQHIILVAAAQKAVTLAADGTYDTESAEAYGVYQVKKLYLHLYTENPITLNVTAPLSALDGKTAFELAKEAYAEHISQQHGRHSVTNEGIYSLSAFGLAFSTVGADTESNDMMENIDPSLLLLTASTPEPEETPEPSPEETLAPTETVSPTDTPAPTDTPLPRVTVLPTDTPEPSSEQAQGGGNLTALLAVLGGLALGILALAAVMILKRRRG